jgi:hypothetical protein
MMNNSTMRWNACREGALKRQDISCLGMRGGGVSYNLIIFLSVVELAFFYLTLDIVCVWLLDAAPATIQYFL